MKSDDFERAYNDFLERKEYDEAENALFEVVRAAFNAGWLAAGGEPLKPEIVFELLQKPDSDKS